MANVESAEAYESPMNGVSFDNAATMDDDDSGSQFKKENNTLGVWGNKTTMNLNHLVLENIVQSPYYRNNLSGTKTFHELIDEIYYNVNHLEPWEKGTRKTTGQTGMCGGVRGVGAGGVVSTPFCIMYRLFTMRLTRKQVYSMLNHTDSPYIRGLGFMYIRFCLQPSTFWEWYEPYLEDEEKFKIEDYREIPLILLETKSRCFVHIFYEDFYTYNDGKPRRAKLYKNYTDDYGYLK
uniref:Pre-mRNA-splicing factor 38 n=1 Tax=Romanomermis culicivorax TaxID=13658 RepID=A0A915K618_ROMCU